MRACAARASSTQYVGGRGNRVREYAADDGLGVAAPGALGELVADAWSSWRWRIQIPFGGRLQERRARFMYHGNGDAGVGARRRTLSL